MDTKSNISLNSNNIIVGLDIGTTKISVMVGKKDKYGKLEILSQGKASSFTILSQKMILRCLINYFM